MDFPTYRQVCQQRVAHTLEIYLPSADEEPKRLHAAMRYAVLNGGKRLRPLLVYATGAALAIAPEKLDLPACAIELIHAYSLVHDDLPAMDNDELRRGQPTCHMAFDEATAILTGDALQSLAFQLLAKDITSPHANKRLKMVQILANSSGSLGMAGGQALDLAAVAKDVDLAYLENMHALKTGALICSGVELAILVADSIPAHLQTALQSYAAAIGLAFQIQDDILDVEGNTFITGKRQGKDQSHNKPNYPAIIGLARAKIQVEQLYTRAIACLNEFDKNADYLREIAGYIIKRNH